MHAVSQKLAFDSRKCMHATERVGSVRKQKLTGTSKLWLKQLAIMFVGYSDRGRPG